jgi:hypothetical protein
MRDHGRGGSLLVVPAETQLWRESVAWPVLYSVVPPFTALAELIHNRDARNTDRHWADALRSAVDAVAGLTAVDGAAVISDPYEVLAFWGEDRAALQVGKVIVTEPIEEVLAEVVDPGQLGDPSSVGGAVRA